MSETEQSAIERLRIAREALEYLLEHHADGKECLCQAARSVAAAGFRLSEDSRS